MPSVLRIFRYLRYFPWQLILNVLCSLLSVLFNLGSFVMIVPFVELLFGSGDVPTAEPELGFSAQAVAGWVFYHLAQMRTTLGLWRVLLLIGGGYLACSLLSNLMRFLSNALLATIRNGVIERLRNDIYHRITVLPISFFTHSRRGDLISRMTGDLFDVEWSIVSTMQSLVKDPINIIVFCATLIFVSWRLFLLFLLVLPAGVWLISIIGKSLRRNSVQGQQQLGTITARLEESLAALRVVKLAGWEQRQADAFAEANAGYARTMSRVARRRELGSPLSEILGTLALVIILIVGGWQVTSGYIQPSVFIFFVIVFARLIPPIQAVVKAYNSLQKGDAAAARFFEVLDADEVVLEMPGAAAVSHFENQIVLHDVCFSYSGSNTAALHHINLQVHRGEMVAIVGPSGSGKSTLVDLLPRFYDPQSGSITLDGVDIRTLRIDSLRSLFGLVSQDCILFNDTVSANIAFGATGYTDEQIRAAARVAGADEFIQLMPQGYDTPIGERGMALSGGQRQRISIARAVLRDTPILILDEATSALDSESESQVQQALETVMHGRTAIVVAHRLATIRHADRIVVLDGGRIAEQGTHDELMHLGGLYSTLVAMQTFA